MRALLDRLTANLDGSTAAATVINRKRAVVHNLFGYAVERELLAANPLTNLRWKRPKRVEQVDPRVVINPAQARELLTAVSYVGRRIADRGPHQVGFFAASYYSAARPGEVANLRETDCTLPERGWGELTLWESRPAAGSRWTDSGEVHDRRGLKHRAARDTRPVPIPPALVRLLRDHIGRLGLAEDGRLLQSPNGGVVGSATYARVWAQARSYAFTPAQVASPLAGRPYDLRHAAVSTWLNAGVPAPEVAARAGHSVDVLMKVYAKCLDGQRDLVNERIAAVLATRSTDLRLVRDWPVNSYSLGAAVYRAPPRVGTYRTTGVRGCRPPAGRCPGTPPWVKQTARCPGRRSSELRRQRLFPLVKESSSPAEWTAPGLAGRPG